MRILFCDDDPLIIQQLNRYVQEFFAKNHLKCPEIAIFSDGDSLLSDTGKKDILFLDVEMPGVDGIYVGNELKKKYKNIIIFIVTSYMEYLDEAMRFQVFRYLSKPLEKQRLFRNLKEALALYSSSDSEYPIETRQGIRTVSASDIIFVEAQGRKVIIHTVQQDYESIHNMQHWLELLPESSFFLSHRSFLVNLAYVQEFDHSLIFLHNGTYSAYLTRRKYSAFKAAYLLYLESTR